MQRGTLAGADGIGAEAGKVLNTYKVGKHFSYTITATSFSYARSTAKIEAEAELDGIYVLRTPMPASGPGVHAPQATQLRLKVKWPTSPEAPPPRVDSARMRRSYTETM